MKCLIFSDLHLHTWNTFGSSSNSILPRRLIDQLNILDQISKLISTEQVSLCIFGGDWFNKRGQMPVECSVMTAQWISNLPCPRLFVRGNHDLLNDVNYHEMYDSLQAFEVMKPTNIEKYSNIKLINYCDVVNEDEIKGYDIVVAHKIPAGSKLLNHTFSDGINWKKLAANNKSVWFGHIHQRQILSSNCFVIGAPMILNFGEIETRGVWIVTDEVVDSTYTSLNNGLHYKFINLKYPDFKTVETADQILNDGNYYKVLRSDSKIDNDRVVSITVPKYYDERIKSSSVYDILNEWIKINNKDISYFDCIKDLIIDTSEVHKNIFKGKIASITIENLFSHEYSYLPIEPGFISICGKNGAGKSSIAESIFWTLTGETTKGLTGDSVIRKLPTKQKEAIGTLELNDNDRSIKVSRSTKSGLTVIEKFKDGRVVNRTDGLTKPQRQQLFEKEILGVNKDIILSTCYFSQIGLVMLTSMGDADKTNMISNILGFEEYDLISARLSKKIDLYMVDKQSIGNRLIFLNTEISLHQNSIQNKISEKTKYLSDVDIETTSIHNCRSLISICNNKLQSLSVPDSNTTDYDKMLIDLNDMKSILQKSIMNKMEECSKLNENKTELLVKTSAISTKLGTYNSQIRKLEHEQSLLKNMNFGERCDKCGNVITTESISIFIKEKELEISKLLKESDVIQSESLALRSEIDNLNEKRMALEQSIKLKNIEISNIDKNIKDTENNKIIANKNKIEYDSAVSDLNTTIAVHNSKIIESEKHIHTLNNRITELDTDIETLTIKVEDLKTTICKDKELEIEITDRLEKAEFWKKSFTSKGIKALLLDKFCNEFNYFANYYLTQISNGTMSVQLSPTSETKSGELRNKISINVTLTDYNMEYSELSGGEKRRVDISLCLALNKWISTRYAIDHGLLGLIILDEIFSFVDPAGEESVATVLKDEGQNKAVFIISHTPDINTYTDSSILIEKTYSVSTIRR